MKKFLLLFLLLIFMLSACTQPPTPTNNRSDLVSNGTQSSNAESKEENKEENNDPYPLNDISDTKITVTENEKVFSHSGVTISLPIDWICKELNAEDGSCYFFRHPELNDKCEIIYEVTAAELLGKKRTEEEYLEYLSYDNHKDVKIDSFTEEKVGGYNSTKIVSSYLLDNTKFIRIDYDYIIVGFKLCSFTITYPVSEADNIEPVLDSIVNSIKLKED